MPETVHALAQRLRRAPTVELRRLVVDHAREIGLRELRQVLLNPHASAEVLDELARVRSITAMPAARAGLARHRRLPPATAMRLIPNLFWHDLLEISVDPRIVAPVRRVAETYLIRRLPRLAVGEKVTLARRAWGTVLEELRRDPDPRVIAAWLENPRLTEEPLVALAANPRTAPRILDLVWREERWGRRYPVRVALSRNPRSPLAAVLAILPGLQTADLAAVLEVPELSSLVAHRVRQLLAERPSPPSEPAV